MSLPTGQYTIISLAGNPIGRHTIEDRSFDAKRIVTLPKHLVEPRIWQIDQTADGKHKLKTGGAVVGLLPDNLVRAFLLEKDIQGAEWRITHVPQHGENAYIIETPDKKYRLGRQRRGNATVSGTFSLNSLTVLRSEVASRQVAVKHLRSTDSLPPQYPPTEVFNIIKVPE